MRRRIVASLVLIVLLPTGLLAWMGERMARNEQQLVQAQLRSLVDSRLADIDAQLQDYFMAVQEDLLQRASGWDGRMESLAGADFAPPPVGKMLVIGADGKLLHPAADGPLNQSQKEFLTRIAGVLDNPALLTQGAALARRVPSKTGMSSTSLLRNDTDTGQPAMGWYVWQWNAQLHHLFWWRDPRGRILGFELLPVAVMSDLIARLPANAQAQPQSTTRLLTTNAQVLYEWGGYRPPAGGKSIAVWPLSHPLGSWRLEYFAPAPTRGSAASTLGVISAALMAGLALAALGLFLYREHSREMRVAQQRVSFVNQVSHELKTPLTNVRLYAELLEAELEGLVEDGPPLASTKAGKYIGILTAESLRLSRLIADVLSFGQLQKSQLRLNRQPGQVDEVVRRCLDAFQPALQAREIAVHLDAGAPAPVLLDPQVLEQILNNLISNVEKYAAAGREMHILTTQQRDTTSIEVHDFGPGIPPAERERIFQPFYRISSRLADGVTGTGIGLDIARRLARLHGGDVVLLDSGGGARFRVLLNTPAPNPQHRPAAGTHQ